jgi:tetratricopeptide (TPR) repeat protein
MGPEGAVNLGVAAHITAASRGGPRFDESITAAERSSVRNGIWLCQACATLIDKDAVRYTVPLLNGWKKAAVERARSRIERPARPQEADEPTLVIPSTSAETSWLAFSARATRFVGRDDETERLREFLRADQTFLWWLISGSGGAGKSRLALELCRDSKTWNAGFLSRVDPFARWSNFRPLRPTLIIVDYVSSRAGETSAMVLQLARSALYLPHPVRVVLIERYQGAWWHQFLREESQSEAAELAECQYDAPLQLGPLSPAILRVLAKETADARGTPWTESTDRTFDSRMRTLDPLGRPLFGMLAAAFPDAEAGGAAVESSVFRAVLSKEAARRRVLLPDDAARRKMENLIVLATLVGGVVPTAGKFTHSGEGGVAPILPDPNLLDYRAYGDLVGASSDSVLMGLQPDILGERFVLDRLAGDVAMAQSTRSLVALAWNDQPRDLCEFILRTVSDFPGDPAIDLLCQLPLESASARVQWGWLVGAMLHIARRAADRQPRRLLDALRKLASTHPAEDGVRTALARAELYLGNTLLFADHDLQAAEQQFDRAIELAGPGSEVAAAAVNNRGILRQEIHDEDLAFTDWSSVIEMGDVSDEARACSLNNRADIYARRNAHEEAIKDRTAVLGLKDTSADRRYIALVRRSNSYRRLGRTDDALRDLVAILEAADISPHQKGEARVVRAELYRELGRLNEAGQDLEDVIASDELFPGTCAEAFVELAELARVEGRPEKASIYLAEARRLPDIGGDTLVDALIVHARLLSDQGEVEESERVWLSVLANSNATSRQISLAENRGASP